MADDEATVVVEPREQSLDSPTAPAPANRPRSVPSAPLVRQVDSQAG